MSLDEYEKFSKWHKEQKHKIFDLKSLRMLYYEGTADYIDFTSCIPIYKNMANFL